MSYTANVTVSTTFMGGRVSLTVDNTETPRERRPKALSPTASCLVHAVKPFINSTPNEPTTEAQAWPSRAQQSELSSSAILSHPNFIFLY